MRRGNAGGHKFSATNPGNLYHLHLIWRVPPAERRSIHDADVIKSEKKLFGIFEIKR